MDPGLPGRHRRRDTSSIELNYNAKNVYLVAGGEGTVTVVRDGKTTTVPHQRPSHLTPARGGRSRAARPLEVRLSEGLQAFSFTYG